MARTRTRSKPAGRRVPRARLQRQRPVQQLQRLQQAPSDVPSPGGDTTPQHLPSQPPVPTHRHLRGYAFDPSLATKLETALVSEITYTVPWERSSADPSASMSKWW